MGDERPEPSRIEDFRPYLSAIARLQLAARPWLTPKMDASDLVQQVLLKAHVACDQFRGDSPGEMAVWLRQILTRTLANELRAGGRAKRDISMEVSPEAELDASSCRLDAWLAAEQTSPSQQAGNREQATRVAEAIEELPEDQREVILLKHAHGLSLSETAARLNRTIPAVAGLLRRGLEQLRTRLDSEHSQ